MTCVEAVLILSEQGCLGESHENVAGRNALPQQEPRTWGPEMPRMGSEPASRLWSQSRGHGASAGNTGAPFVKRHSPPSEFVFRFSPDLTLTVG